MIKIEKTIYVRDRHKVKRQAFVAGQEVSEAEYYAVLSSTSVVNPEDLPTAKKSVETKMLEKDSNKPVVKVVDEPKKQKAITPITKPVEVEDTVETVEVKEEVSDKPETPKRASKKEKA